MDRPLLMNLLKTACVVAIFGLPLGVAGGVSAQTLNGTLRDVNNLEIAIEPLDSDARDCGIDETKLIEAVTEGAEGAGFTLGGYDYALYLRISSLPRASDCFSSIDIEVRYVGKLALPAYPNGNRARAVLWSNGIVIFSARNQHGREVTAVVTQLVQSLAADWGQDNARQRAG